MRKDQFAKEGEFLPFVKGGKEGFSPQCPYNYGLISNWIPSQKVGFQHLDDLFPCGTRIVFDSITYYLLHYWEFYLSREDVKPIPQGHHLVNPGDGIDLRVVP
jgi:hypothetical protein